MGDGGEGGGVQTDWGARLVGLVRDVSYLFISDKIHRFFLEILAGW